LGALVLVWVSFIALGLRTGQHEADELTDGHLASVTALLLAFAPGELVVPAGVPAAMLAPQLKAHDYQQSMSVVVWDRHGAVVARTGGAPLPAFDGPLGFATLSLGQPPQEWRAFSRWDDGRERKVMVLLSARERDELAEDIAGQIAEPGLWLLPVVALVLGLAIRRGLRPLYALSRDVHALDIQHATPLETRSRHEELRTAAVAINTLMERYQAALGRERALANEFAHEMRTPLAAVAMQAHALKGLPEGPARDQALARMEVEVKRAGQVLSDLLALARASRVEWDESAQPVDVAALARAVVADLAPAAHARGHELSLVAPESLTVSGHGLLLELALRNLVENALHHTGHGSEVTVEINADEGWVQVSDDGGQPVIDSAPRAPGRALGLGLGHRVVQKIAAVHGADFARASQAGSGRCYRITFGAGAADA
jgi:two-component system, OmpR family, sensor histidine kinase QseC